MFTDPTGKHQGIKARQRGSDSRHARRGSTDEHIDGEPGALVSRSRGFLDLAHARRPTVDTHQTRLVIENLLELPPPHPPGAQHMKKDARVD